MKYIALVSLFVAGCFAMSKGLDLNASKNWIQLSIGLILYLGGFATICGSLLMLATPLVKRL